jgi:uncharacterized membrane protein YcaP (DUF421 family)
VVLDWIWKATLMVFTGVLLLRIAGRKSISHMTLAQTVVMISIGSIIIQPIIETNVWKTIGASAIFIGALVLMEYLQIKFNFIEKFITGKAKIIIREGQIELNTLKKLRFTVDQLEMRLRQAGITEIHKVKYATLEPNGHLGYELYPDAQPLTVGEFKRLMSSYIQTTQQPEKTSMDIFEEIMDRNKQNNPEQLQ